MVLLSEFSALSNILRLILLLIIFVALLFGAHFFTKWYGKSGLIHARTANIEILESQQLSPGKNIVIARIGSKYVSFILFKEHAAVLAELNEEELCFEEKKEAELVSFKEIFQRVTKQEKKGSVRDWLKSVFRKRDGD